MSQKSGTQELSGIMTVINDRGLHTRPATALVKCASQYKSLITLNSQDMQVNAKSLLGILTLSATKGTRIRVTASGVDAEEAVHALEDLAARGFDIEY